MSRALAGVALVVLAALLPVGGAAALPSAPADRGRPTGPAGPEGFSFGRAWAHSWRHPGSRVPGANLPCRPAPGEDPVVLIPGTNEDAYATWSTMAPRLHRAGLCVFTFNHNPAAPAGHRVEALAFTGDIRESAEMLAAVVDDVRRETGARRVDLVGHSQGGGPLAHWYLTRLGGDRAVDRLIGIAPSNDGIDPLGVAGAMDAAPGAREAAEAGLGAWNLHAWPQQIRGSELLRQLRSGPLTRDPVRYTVLVSRADRVVAPPEGSFIDEPGVRNIRLQDLCPADRSGHFDLPHDPAVAGFVLRELRDDPATAAICPAPPWR